MGKKEETNKDQNFSGIGNKISEFFNHLIAYGGLTFREGIVTMWNDHHVLTPISTFYLLQKELVKRYKENGESLIYLSF